MPAIHLSLIRPGSCVFPDLTLAFGKVVFAKSDYLVIFHMRSMPINLMVIFK